MLVRALDDISLSWKGLETGKNEKVRDIPYIMKGRRGEGNFQLSKLLIKLIHCKMKENIQLRHHMYFEILSTIRGFQITREQNRSTQRHKNPSLTEWEARSGRGRRRWRYWWGHWIRDICHGKVWRPVYERGRDSSYIIIKWWQMKKMFCDLQEWKRDENK